MKESSFYIKQKNEKRVSCNDLSMNPKGDPKANPKSPANPAVVNNTFRSVALNGL
jgi:hypothetical protein